jgi:succinyldiaminopimelate transaminase
VDLSVGTPVDPVPALVQEALRAAANAPGYPAAHGTRALREAAAGWLARRHGVTVEPDAVLPLIGTKEFIASLPALLGCGPGDVVVYPELAYPTYDIGARLAGADAMAADELPRAGLAPAPQASATKTTTSATPDPVRLVWVNSPSNPTGRVLSAGQLAAAARAARDRGAVLASDECYIGLGWTAEPVSVLHPDVCGGSFDGLLAVHSVSKRSNLAGYRAGFVTGDPALVAQLLEIRKHAGMMMPTPVQAAMAAALADDAHAERQRSVYAARREQLRPALEKAGWTITHSEAGLYLWASRPGYDCWASVDLLAGAGILVAPGEFYGPAGAQHIRVALTATDERVAAAAHRLTTLA